MAEPTRLRDFRTHVVVNEFAAAEPAPETWCRSFLCSGIRFCAAIPVWVPRQAWLVQRIAAEKRGERFFNAIQWQDPGLSCSGCHHPAEERLWIIASRCWGVGLYKTPGPCAMPTSTRPIFHAGRFDTYDQVGRSFHRDLLLGPVGSRSGRLDAYLEAIGDGDPGYDTG